MRLARVAGQVVVYLAFGILLAVLSREPRHAPLAEGMALIQVSMVHAGARLAPCRTLSAEELAARAPNMRAPQECPRARSPVRVVVELDDRMLVDEMLAPSGFAQDGAATLYRRLPVAAGRYRLQVRVDDNPGDGRGGVTRRESVHLGAGQILTVDFRPDQGGVIFL